MTLEDYIRDQNKKEVAKGQGKGESAKKGREESKKAEKEMEDSSSDMLTG